MSATRYKKPHVDILICIEMTRERNLGIKKKHPVYITQFLMVQGSLNPKCYIRKKSKNAFKKRKNENFEKQKK